MTCNPMLGPKALVLEHSGMFESKAKKRASPVTIPLETIERVERGQLGRTPGTWCRIVLRGAGDPPPLTDDPLAFQTWPQLEPFLDRLEAAVARGPVDPPKVPWPVRRPESAGAQAPMERGRTSAAFDWLSG